MTSPQRSHSLILFWFRMSSDGILAKDRGRQSKPTYVVLTRTPLPRLCEPGVSEDTQHDCVWFCARTPAKPNQNQPNAGTRVVIGSCRCVLVAVGVWFALVTQRTEDGQSLVR